MKKIILYSFMACFLLASACRKSDNVKVPELTKVPYPLIVKDNTTDVSISAQTPDLFKAKYTVGLFFPNGIKPAKYDVVIRKNLNNSNVKLVKSDVTVYPTTLEITGLDLKGYFGASSVLGDKYDIGVDITTTEGRKFEAFPLVGASYSPGSSSPEGASLIVRYEAVCKYIPADYAGTFVVVTDDWADFGVGSDVVLTVVNDHQLSFVSPASGLPILIDIDVNTNETSVKKQSYGDYGGAWPYGNATITSVKSLDNFVAPCDKVLSLLLNYTVAAGNFGDFPLVLKKK